MDIMISLKDMFLILLFLLIAGVCVYLIVTLKNVTSTVKNLNKLIEANTENINSVVTTLPKIAKNVDKITEAVPQVVNNVNDIVLDVKGSVDTVTDTVDVVGAAVTKTAVDVTEKTELAAQYISIGTELVKNIVDIIRK
ncbi:Uncharacterized protein YoxC, contains an MCP-like domain [Clostridium amylolyticum]|uniref:Uncharacterized protein YoxC, contains an MCP-like domain n=1 Tax=Clostridium amylolyticum TaxID=1121298 RepID=A0A1M6GID0_9CLOT|nr:hypothetical protein [Clostridium amylolyticum]SHJ09714.1 Uncharacterized protein YoxC, contains an MCP-like domain [Clostridium amylolyticum]